MITGNILQQCHNEGFQEEEIYGAYKIFFGTLVSESRLRVINLLRKGKKNVSEITADLNIDQTVISHDLARLKKCGFVRTEIQGKYRYYTLNKETIELLMQLIDDHMKQYCIHILQGMKHE
ncbi:MAG: metalloregulator ArsR/SmtB family transcription factor [Nanoarchaeota archaeon]